MFCNFMWGGKRRNKTKKKVSKKAEEDRSSKAVTDRQMDRETKLNEQFYSDLSVFNFPRIATKKDK